MRIFIVDDHRDVAEGLADVLRLHGHEVEVAFNGEQAIRIFREQDFDIAFMDVMMPGMNGVESFLEIRKIKPEAKVIMMTGYSVEQLLDQAIDNGAYGVLHKPVGVNEVLEALERVNSQGMVLVADDDPDFSANIMEVLKDNGYKVCRARTGKQALNTVLAGGIDLLLLDLKLPVISGLEVYLELQKRGRALPTVVVTGYSTDQSEALDVLKNMNATGILTKPFDAGRMLEALEQSVAEAAQSKQQGSSRQPAQVEAPAPTAAPEKAKPAAVAAPAKPPARPAPAAPSAKVPQAQAFAQPAPQIQRGRILAVDDDEDMVNGLAEVLETQGYEVKTAYSAEGAKKAIQGFDAQVALLDIRLGNTSGLELIPMLKEHSPNIYCVMVTGNADRESAITALRHGAYDYMTKPLHPNELFSLLDRCLDKFRLQYEARSAFEALQIAKDSAESTSRGKSDFLAAMSRELRNPINSIIGSSKVLIDQAWGPIGAEQYTAHAKNIRDTGTRLIGVISYAIDLAKAESGRMELNEEGVDIGDLMSQTATLIRNSLGDGARLQIDVKLPDSPLQIWGDERQLKQILLNLLSNAVKFTPGRGKVQLSLRWVDEGGVAIEVRDTGIGMAKSEIPTALAQFGRVETQACREYQGAGLGLPLVAAIAELHGGRLALDSDPGKGTTATVFLPAERVADKKSAA